MLRLRAVLAGGLVLGLGTTATLAAWNDSEYASTTVTASRFGIEGNMNATGFSEHATSPGPTITFSPTLGAMSPNTVGFASIVIRTTAASTIGGTVQLQVPAPPTDTLAQNLQYAVRTVPSGLSCNEALFSNATAAVIVPNGTLLTAAPPANSQALSAAAANPVTYCFRIAMPSNAASAAQGLSTTVTWQFLGTSS